MRVPFIASWARRAPDTELQQSLPIPRGAIQSQVASVEDIFPTLTELTGAKVEGDHLVDGSSMAPLLVGKRDDDREEQFLMHYPHGPHRSNYFTVWRNGDWKAIYHALPKEKAHGGSIQSEGITNCSI